MKIEMNDKGIFVDDEKIDGDNVRIVKTSRSFGSNNTFDVGNTGRINGREVTGFWGGCIAFMTAGFGLLVAAITLLGVALMFAAPFAVLIGLGWLIARAMGH